MLTEFIKNLIFMDKTGVVPPTHEPLLAHDQMTLRNMEKYSLHRFRERYDMKTSSIQAFIDYTNARGKFLGHQPMASVDPDECAAAAIFNYTDGEKPGQCDDTASCRLNPLPMYAELMRIAGCEKGRATVSQRELIDWIRDWNIFMNDPTALVEAFSKLSVERLQNRLQKEGDYQAERSETEKIQVKADSAEVPNQIDITFRPYEGFNEQKVVISTSAATDRNDNHVVIRLRPLGFDQLKLTVADEFAEKLKSQLSTKPVIGTIRPS